jgi:hypothetical protein
MINKLHCLPNPAIFVGLMLLVFSFYGLIDSAVASNTDKTLMPKLNYYPYEYFRYGDCNGDGWCNEGDIRVLVQNLTGGDSLCESDGGESVGDINGDDVINGADIIALANFLLGIGSQPAYECSWEVPEVQYSGRIEIDDCQGSPGDTVLVDGYLETPGLISAFHFSLAYDNREIDTIFVSSYNSIFDNNNWLVCQRIKDDLPPGNDDTLNTITFMFTAWAPFTELYPVEFPNLTQAFTLTVVISDSYPDPPQDSYYSLPFEADPDYGPPMLYMEDAWDGYEFDFQTDDIPTLSEWGMIILGLLLMVAGTIAVIRRQKVIFNRSV